MSRLRQDFTTLTWVMIPVAIAINIAVGTLVYTAKIPFVYLDSIGTVLVGVLCGPWAGLLTGLFSNLIWGYSGLNPIYTPYFIVGGVIGLFAGLFSRWGWMRTWWQAILAGAITGVISAACSAPITAYLYGGVTGAGTDVITAFFRSIPGRRYLVRRARWRDGQRDQSPARLGRRLVVPVDESGRRL